mgnify:CR=1 FL=1
MDMLYEDFRGTITQVLIAEKNLILEMKIL